MQLVLCFSNQLIMALQGWIVFIFVLPKFIRKENNFLTNYYYYKAIPIIRKPIYVVITTTITSHSKKLGWFDSQVFSVWLKWVWFNMTNPMWYC